MNEYHKIQSMYKRDIANNGKMLFGQWSLPEFEYLAGNQWRFSEKIDGTNIRVMFDGTKITYGGKTDNAQIHGHLIARLQEMFDDKLTLFKETFEAKENEETRVCFYGEGYGAGIQKGGGLYQKTKEFILFDIKIGHLFLQRKDVEEIGDKFSVRVVPIVGEGTLKEAEDIVRKGYKSQWGDFLAEGIVARPKIEMRDRRGNRIITKLKHKDYSV